MYSHLDDSELFVAGHAFRRNVDRRARRLTRHRRFAHGALVVLVFIGAGALYVERRDAAINRVDVTTIPSTDGATNLLLIGDEGGRADTIVVVRVESDGSGRTISVPRDLWDPVVGDRVSTTYARGPQAVIDSVERTTHIPIDHYLAVDFQGFVQIVDELGGLRVAVDQPIRDQLTGLDLPAASCVALDGKTVLALVRSRHLEIEDANSVWQPDPTGDLGRVNRAQAVMRIALDALGRIGPDPIALDRVTRAVADHVTVDSGLDLHHLVDLAHRLATAAGSTTFDSLPVVGVTRPDGAAVLELADGSATVLRAYGAALEAGPTGPEPASVPAVVAVRPC